VDISIPQVHARLEALWPQLLASTPLPLTGPQRDYYLKSPLLVASAETGIDYILRGRFGRPVVALFGLAVIVLLGSLVNLAHLLLAKLVDRQREFAVRLALGASRGRLIREVALEGLLLVAMGSVAGVAAAVALNGALVSLFATLYPGFALEAGPSGDVWWLVLSGVVGVQAVFSLVPTLCVRRVDLASVAAATPRIVSHRSTARTLLVAAQVALSVVLLTVGGVTIDSLWRLRETPLGWDVDRVLTGHLAPLPGVIDRESTTTTYYHQLLDEIAVLPGVQSAAMARQSPLFHTPYIEAASVHGSEADSVRAEQQIVSERFFETLGVALISGRIFTRQEDARSPEVAIISQSLATRLFGTRTPLGHRIRVGVRAETASLEIVGVVTDAILLEPRKKNTLTVYRSFWQVPPSLQRSSELLVRTLGSPASAAGGVRGVITRAGQEFPQFLRPVSEHRDIAFADERLMAWFGSVFAGVGLAVAALGIFGLLSHVVSTRRREVGLRMALGANQVNILRMVFRQALVMTVLGLSAGVPIGSAIGRAATQVFGQEGSLPVKSVMISIAFVVAAGLLAAVIPARRAAVCDPGAVLRDT
jgi:predicted permease